MRLVHYIRSAIQRGPSLPVDDEVNRKNSERRTVSRVASGNIRLQRGEYLTREDIDRKYENVKSCEFNER